jgi:hypothetical protein
MKQITDGLWTAPSPLTYKGLRLNTRMTVCRLSDGSPTTSGGQIGWRIYARSCGSAKLISGPRGTTPVGLMVVWLA